MKPELKLVKQSLDKVCDGCFYFEQQKPWRCKQPLSEKRSCSGKSHTEDYCMFILNEPKTKEENK